MDERHLFDWKGQKVIVTGGASGMGYETARLFGLYGAKVCIIDISDKLEETAGRLKEATGAEYQTVRANLSDSADRKRGFAEAAACLEGELDVLVNCAGIQYTCDSVEFPEEAWKKVLSVNLDAVFDLSQMAGRMMLKKGHGKIINYASMLSYIGGFRVPAYAASKGAVVQLTKALSNEWAAQGIQVNAVAPGYIMTPLNLASSFPETERGKFILSRIPAGRWGEPEEIAAVVLFLASPAASYMTGAVVPVDGGFAAS